MLFVTLRGKNTYLDEALLRATQMGNFHIEAASELSEYSSGLVAMSEDNPYTPIINKLNSIRDNVGIVMKETDCNDMDLTKEEIRDYVEEFSKRFDSLNSKREGINRLLESHKSTLTHLNHIAKLDINLDELFAAKYLCVRFGKLPVSSYQKLNFSKDMPFTFFSYDNDGTYHWCLYLCAESDKDEIDGLFNSLYFERMRIPDYAHGTPSQSISFIEKDIEKETEKLNAINKEIDELLNAEECKLSAVYTKLNTLAVAFDLRKYAGFVKNDFVLIGYIPSAARDEFDKGFEVVKDRIAVTYKDASEEERIKAPVKLKNNALVRPFEMFVNIYGLPGYNDVDPTKFVGITYMILFGIMFGDVGQGLVIALLGWFLAKKKKMELGSVMTNIGISSAIFGFFYGSVFGFEELLVPVHRALFGRDHLIHIMAPETTNMLLIGAIAIGIIIIIASMSMNVYIGFRKKDIERAVFSNNGLAGIIFYVSILVMVLGKMALGIDLMKAYIIVPCIVLPLLIIFFKEPLGRLLEKKKPFPDGFGGFFVESFFEMFEVLLSFVSNTMSFLRVGGFILSHAGMMAVVMTLSSMVSAGASPIVVVLGNIFVMALEGLIVGIQVLRLEFYEVFSRFFDGDGKTYEPVSVK